jgi:hypothetical protein
VFDIGYYTIALIHAALGTAAELVGIYIVLMAGTELVPTLQPPLTSAQPLAPFHRCSLTSRCFLLIN